MSWYVFFFRVALHFAHRIYFCYYLLTCHRVHPRALSPKTQASAIELPPTHTPITLKYYTPSTASCLGISIDGETFVQRRHELTIDQDLCDSILLTQSSSSVSRDGVTLKSALQRPSWTRANVHRCTVVAPFLLHWIPRSLRYTLFYSRITLRKNCLAQFLEIPCMTLVECYSDQHNLPTNEELQKVIVDFRGSSDSPRQPSASSSPQDFPEDPGLGVLVGSPEENLRLHTQAARSSKISRGAKMVDQPDEPPPLGESPAEHHPSQLESATKLDEHGSKSSIDSGVGLDVSDLVSDKEQADQVLSTTELATRTRSDSMQQTERPRSDAGSPLRITTSNSSTGATSSHEKDDSISASPTLSKHVIPSADIHGESLAPFEPLSPSTSSPKAERLPSIHQITSSLTELAEAATQEMPRQQQSLSHHHSHSFGSATSQSPVLANRPYPIAIQTSPQAYYPTTMLARSPTSVVGESQWASPPAYPSYGAYNHRRASAADGVPPLMPNLPTASSSGDSYGGYLSSSTEGYSTNHTTPIDVGQALESTPRPMLPPPPGMHGVSHSVPAPIMIPGPYKCDVPDCTAGTFQTQYLLK